ncbi:DUF4288 domain-containing protein [Pseudonocardia sp. GCM10023141]|uniref:DUF4288 domain-containing protein n=1 Tax=Pseudonocardia sp. GCM10023141 TaxID=3252653 RepID=UPI003619743F
MLDQAAETPMTPYIAILLSESSGSVGSAGRSPLYCEDIMLVHATSIEDARDRARRRGEQASTTYATADGGQVRWSFVQVVDVAPILDNDLTRDADLYARFFRNHQAYRAFEPLLDAAPL